MKYVIATILTLLVVLAMIGYWADFEAYRCSRHVDAQTHVAKKAAWLVVDERPSLKRRHPIFDGMLGGLELLFGCWCCWDGVYWLGFLDRRGLRGSAETAGGFLISVHGGYVLISILLSH